ncbi:MAG: N-acetylmuramoyl-L-alanine amidase, partial [Elusimicrobiaceae bacterium]
AYLFGNVKPAEGKFTINGAPVKVYPNGAFLAFLPVKEGPFAFECALSYGAGQSTKTVRNIMVGAQKFVKPAGPDQIYIDTTTLSPYADTVVRYGDWIDTAMNASPGKKAVFKIKGLTDNIPMQETDPGRYTGAYLVKPDDRAISAEIAFTLENGKLPSELAVSTGKVTVATAPFTVVQVTTDSTGARCSVSNGYIAFLEPGQKLLATGRTGSRIRLKLTETLDGWAEKSALNYLPQGEPPPLSAMGTISTAYQSTATVVSVENGRNAPYMVFENEDSLEVTFLYTKNDTNWIVYDSSDTLVRDIQYRQLDRQTCLVKINYANGQTPWGYDVDYIKGRTVITLRRKPALPKRTKTRPLAGLKVIIDPGHSPRTEPPYDGAIGPTRVFEYDTNMRIAKVLKAKLEDYGAAPVILRSGDETVALRERPRIAGRLNGDFYVSIHGNALSDSTNPFAQPRGFSLYYYYPHSRPFALNTHRSLQKFLPLPDEGLRYGDYHVIRLTNMPAILIETAYLIIPDQEQMLVNENFQHNAANACITGIYKTLGFEAPKLLPKKVETFKPAKRTPAKKNAVKETTVSKTEVVKSTGTVKPVPAAKPKPAKNGPDKNEPPQK